MNSFTSPRSIGIPYANLGHDIQTLVKNLLPNQFEEATTPPSKDRDTDPEQDETPMVEDGEESFGSDRETGIFNRTATIN